MNMPPAVRIANAVISAAIIVLFLIHGISGSFQLLALGPVVNRVLAYVMLGLVAVHAVFGIWTTVFALKASKAAGSSYAGLNKRFWTARISGLAIIVLVVLHIALFWTNTPEGVVRAAYFGPMQLAVQVLFVLCIAVHVVGNIKPLLISLGVGGVRERSFDLGFALSVVLLFFVVAMALYFISWRVI